MSVPAVDCAGKPGAAGSSLLAALQGPGFVHLTGHGIPGDIVSSKWDLRLQSCGQAVGVVLKVDAAFEAADRFWALPAAAKGRYARSSAPGPPQFPLAIIQRGGLVQGA